MSKLSLLLIPLLFMTSCTIGWNDEKDAKTTELEKQSQDQDKELTNKVIPNISKDFGSGFILSQTDEETTLSYSGKVIKIWSHTPPEKVPFIWDEACDIVGEQFMKLSGSELSGTGRQGVWDRLTEDEKKSCMKENLERSIVVESIDNRFYEIRRVFYETGMFWVYDTQSGNIQEIPTMGDMSVTVSESGVLLVIDMAYGSDTINLLYDANFSKLISQEEIQK